MAARFPTDRTTPKDDTEKVKKPKSAPRNATKVAFKEASAQPEEVKVLSRVAAARLTKDRPGDTVAENAAKETRTPTAGRTAKSRADEVEKIAARETPKSAVARAAIAQQKTAAQGPTGESKKVAARSTKQKPNNAAPASCQEIEKDAILDAAADGNLSQVKRHVETLNGAGQKNDFCMAAVKPAASSGHEQVVKFLVQSVVGNEQMRLDCCMVAAVEAAESGHIQVVKYAVKLLIKSKQSVDLNCKDIAKAAAKGGHMEVVEFLLENISDQSVLNRCRKEAATLAGDADHWDIVASLVPKIADQKLRDQCFARAAEKSAGQKMWPGVEVVTGFMSAIVDRDLKDQSSAKAATQAIQRDRWDLVKSLVRFISSKSVKEDLGKANIQSVASKGDLTVSKLLVETIADRSARDQCCMEAAISAASKNHLNVVKYLVETIGQANFKNDCLVRAATLAAQANHVDVVKFLVSSITDRKSKESIKSVGLQLYRLLESPALLNFFATQAVTGNNEILHNTLPLIEPAQITQLLCLSIKADHVPLARTLLPKVSQVDLPHSSGSATALMLAADAGHHELIQQLLDHEASLSAEDTEGQTALSRACQAGHVRAAKTLADRGADVNHRDHQGLSCVQLAEKFGHSQVVQTLHMPKSGRCQGAQKKQANPICKQDHTPQEDEQVSTELHQLLNNAGFSQQRAKCQQAMANLLQRISQSIAQDDRQMTGSYADGWANSLVQVNGRTAADSDLDWTTLVVGKIFHLQGSCTGKTSECVAARRIQVRVVEGHAQVEVGAGSQPAIATAANGVRPAHDTCRAFRCCSGYSRESSLLQLIARKPPHFYAHLVRATRPNSTNELRVSFSFLEKKILSKLNTVQGQLFTVIKFIFKRLLPHTLKTPGLKTYHAKTLLFFMLEQYGIKSQTKWKPQNLIALLKESLEMMLNFINSSSSPDECMPHFFMSDAPLYFKNAGTGANIGDTKARVRERLSELRSDIGKVVEQIRKHMRPLESHNFYFHPFTLLPLIPFQPVDEHRKNGTYQFADMYCLMHQCVTKLQSESDERDTLMRHLSLLQQLPWCKCAVLCMTAMAHLKFGDTAEAERLMRELAGHQVQRFWKPSKLERARPKKSNHHDWNHPKSSDWAWRFCFPCITQPHFPFLPAFTQTLFTARLSQPSSSHLYVNFRCLSWSLQAELLSNHGTAAPTWLAELQEDPDLEELLTLAHYSDCREQLQFCLRQMESVRDERRVAMETQDKEKIEWVRVKLQRLGNQRRLARGTGVQT